MKLFSFFGKECNFEGMKSFIVSFIFCNIFKINNIRAVSEKIKKLKNEKEIDYK